MKKIFIFLICTFLFTFFVSSKADLSNDNTLDAYNGDLTWFRFFAEESD